ncbi:MAG: hypothetical protein ACRCXZ_07380 [Patescibacteria group bacterium]
MPYLKRTVNNDYELGTNNVAILYEGPALFRPKPHLEIRVSKQENLFWAQLVNFLANLGWEFKYQDKQRLAIVQNPLDFGSLHFLNLVGDVSKLLISYNEVRYLHLREFVPLADIDCVLKAKEIMKARFNPDIKDYRAYGLTSVAKFNF